MIFHITRNNTNTRITFSNFEQLSQKELLLSLSRCVLLTLKCVGGGGGSCIYSGADRNSTERPPASVRPSAVLIAVFAMTHQTFRVGPEIISRAAPRVTRHIRILVLQRHALASISIAPLFWRTNLLQRCVRPIWCSPLVRQSSRRQPTVSSPRGSIKLR